MLAASKIGQSKDGVKRKGVAILISDFCHKAAHRVLLLKDLFGLSVFSFCLRSLPAFRGSRLGFDAAYASRKIVKSAVRMTPAR